MPTFSFSSPIRDTAASVVATLDGAAADLRPLTAGEHEPLQAVFDGLSTASRASRFLTGLPRMPASMVQALSAVDGHDHVAWLASVGGRPAGIGRYVRTAPCTAEIAFEVVDAWQGRGLGSVLVDVLTTVGAVSGIRTLEATVLPSNQPSLRLLRKVGLSFRAGAGQLDGRGPLRLLDVPRVDRPAVVRLAPATSTASVTSLEPWHRRAAGGQ